MMTVIRDIKQLCKSMTTVECEQTKCYLLNHGVPSPVWCLMEVDFHPK